jgi:hypothetical protein
MRRFGKSVQDSDFSSELLTIASPASISSQYENRLAQNRWNVATRTGAMAGVGNATCADQSPRRVVVAGKAVCPFISPSTR